MLPNPVAQSLSDNGYIRAPAQLTVVLLVRIAIVMTDSRHGLGILCRDRGRDHSGDGMASSEMDKESSGFLSNGSSSCIEPESEPFLARFFSRCPVARAVGSPLISLTEIRPRLIPSTADVPLYIEALGCPHVPRMLPDEPHTYRMLVALYRVRLGHHGSSLTP
jgi:hypothetical protein